jgi:hypothetical protein
LVKFTLAYEGRSRSRVHGAEKEIVLLYWNICGFC